MNTVVAGSDIAAVDATCARLMGLNPDDVEYLSLAADTAPGTDSAAGALASPMDALTAATVVSAVSAVMWVTRSGNLLFSVLVGAPAWRHVDLLPIVARQRGGQPGWAEGEGEGEGEDEVEDDAADAPDDGFGDRPYGDAASAHAHRRQADALFEQARTGLAR